MKTLTRHIIILTLIAVGLGRLEAVGAAEEPIGDYGSGDALSLSAVDLYTGGVGLFELKGSVEAGQSIDLRLPRDHVPDVLKSITVLSADGNAIPVFSYETSDAVEHRLQGSYVDLSGSPSRETILQRLRGEVVSLHGASSTTGRIVSVERRMSTEERTVLFVTLFGDDGLVDISLDDVRSIAFEDPAVDQEFGDLLAILRESRIDRESVLSLRLGSSYAGPVRVSYLHAVPLWKTSYRLVAGSEGEYRLQAWGHVDNTTAMAWSNVDLTLVSSRPVAFRMDLLTPLYVNRPQLSPPQATIVAPRRFERSRDMSAESEALPMAPMASGRAFDEAAPEPAATGAATSEVPTAVRYHVMAEVDLRPGRGAMLPILDTLVPGRRVSLYRSSDGETPRAAVEIGNETGVALLAGPVTVLDGGSFVGDALIGDISAGETTVLSYALDTDTTVLTEEQSQPETISSLRIVDGLFVSTRIRSLRTVYRFTHRGDNLGVLIIEHRRRPGWEVVGGLLPVSESESFLRFEAPLSGVSDQLEVIEELPVSSTIALDTLSQDQIVFFLNQPVIDSRTAGLLRDLQAILGELRDVEQAIESDEDQIDEVFRDQGRIRDNLEAVPEGSDLARRYLTTLREQEDRLQELRNSVEGLQQRARSIRSRLDQLILSTES